MDPSVLAVTGHGMTLSKGRRRRAKRAAEESDEGARTSALGDDVEVGFCHNRTFRWIV